MMTCALCPFVILCWQKALLLSYCWSCHALLIKHTERKQLLDIDDNWREIDETIGYSTLQCQPFLFERHAAQAPELHGQRLQAFRDHGRCIRCEPRYSRTRPAKDFTLTHYMVVDGVVKTYDRNEWQFIIEPLLGTRG
jgi:hypothetical protein